MTRVEKAKHSGFCIGLLFSIVLLLLCSIRLAHTQGVLPDTGQARCYNSTSEIPCPSPGQPFYGQDGNYATTQPAYEVSADGLIVTDLNTELMWQRTDDGVRRDWNAAEVYCENSVLGGHLDWRLPSRAELVSIVDYGRYNLSLNPIFSCTLITTYYWSETPGAADPVGNHWNVEFTSGRAHYGSNSNLNLVRCVRGGQ
jgi:hypothetical protein